MRGLLVQDGDLVVGQGGFALTEGPAKVRQDLSLAAAEPYGADRFHPGWGSLLDSYVGTGDPDEGVALIKSEIARVVQNYIAVQNFNLRQDQRFGRANRYAANELVDSIVSIDVKQTYDRFFVRIRVSTFGGSQITLSGAVRG